MPNKIANEEFQYCTHCGAANVMSAVECSECEKKIKTKYRPFYDFLKKHTKDELTEKTTDTVLSYLYRFLLSHIYGVALSVTVVAATVSTTYAVAPHIEKVTETKVATVQTHAEPQTEEEAPIVEEKKEYPPLSSDDLDVFDDLTSTADAFADMKRQSESYWYAPTQISSVSQLYAENNIADYGFSGEHQLNSNPIDIHMLDVYDEYIDNYSSFWSDRYIDFSSAVTGEDCTTDMAKQLMDAGYTVAECNYVLAEGYEDGSEYNFDTHTGGTVGSKLVYRFVFVKDDDEWYIAEDRLIERINV